MSQLALDNPCNLFKVFVKLNKEGQIERELAIFPYDNYRERRGGGVLSIATGEVFVKRFKIKNWKKIKTGI